MPKEKSAPVVPITEGKSIDATVPTPKKVDPLAMALQARMEELEGDERMKLLLNGAVPPPNEFIAYLVQQYQDARRALEHTDAAVRSLRSKLTKGEDQLLVIQGGLNKYLEDIVHWLAKTKEKPDDGADKAPG